MKLIFTQKKNPRIHIFKMLFTKVFSNIVTISII